MRTTSCRACGKQIGFITSTITGKRIPVDPLSIYVETEKQQNAGTLINEQGITMKNPPIGTIAFAPHWSTCTDPNRFRKGKKEKE